MRERVYRNGNVSQRRFRCSIAFAVLCAAVTGQNSLAQSAPDQVRPNDSGRSDDNASPTASTAQRPIRLSTLPPPPAEIAKLIRRGNVQLVTRGQPQSPSITLPIGGRLAGETRFTFHYRYDSRAKWQLENGRTPSRSTTALIQVRFRSIKLIAKHEVWLRNPPPADRFWQDPIVRHEFDHVRLSSDPRIEKQFLDAAKAIERMRVPIAEIRGPNGQIDNTKVQSLIESRMKSALENTTDYVRIRYRELDRLTDHGMKPLPDDAGLIEIRQ